MSRNGSIGWTRDSEREALARLQREHPVVLIYVRQSKTDFDDDGRPIGPSLEQQEADCRRLPELIGCPVEVFSDANRSGKDTSKRPGFLAMERRYRTAPDGTIGAVVPYDASRLHRNDLAFFGFMAEMEGLGILVLDVKREIRNADKLGWKIRAVVADDVRETIRENVRYNLRHLQRGGRLLGHAPLGYRRIDKGAGSKLVEDPIAAPVVKQIFELYKSGQFSLQTLADHLNDQGIVVPQNPDYPKARMTWRLPLIKDLLHNPSYLGMVRVDGELQKGNHPALIDEMTFEKCQEVRSLHRRRKTKYRYHRNSYPLADLLVCSRCGGRFQGKRALNPDGSVRHEWYICSAKRTTHRCDLPAIPAAALEKALLRDLEYRTELRSNDPGMAARVEAGLRKAPDPMKVLAADLKALNGRFGRVKIMFELGTIDQAEYVEKIGVINVERQAAKQRAADAPKADLAWCEAQLGNLVGAWQHADPVQRGQLLGEMFDRLEVDKTVAGGPPFLVTLECVPRPAWRAFFHRVVVDTRAGGDAYAFPSFYTHLPEYQYHRLPAAGGELAAQPSSAD